MYKEIFAKRIKIARENTGYTQIQIETLTGVSRTKIAKYETNLSEPSIEVLGTLAKFYNVSVDWLIGLDS